MIANFKTLAALAVTLAATSAWADDCGLPAQGEGRVAAVIDQRTIRLDDGRDIRLAGLAALPGSHATRAIAALSGSIGRAVAFNGAADAPDRYGRQSFLVTPDGESHSIQAALLAQGSALADLTLPVCVKPFRAAEMAARQARRGIWADRVVIKNAESPDDILAGIGQFAVVEGRVVSVRQSGPMTYINFGRRWTRDFTVTMPVKVLPSFEAAGMAPKAFVGKRLRIRGFVERRGSPRIDVSRPIQVEIVAADDGAIINE